MGSHGWLVSCVSFETFATFRLVPKICIKCKWCRQPKNQGSWKSRWRMRMSYLGYRCGFLWSFAISYLLKGLLVLHWHILLAPLNEPAPPRETTQSENLHPPAHYPVYANEQRLPFVSVFQPPNSLPHSYRKYAAFLFLFYSRRHIWFKSWRRMAPQREAWVKKLHKYN